jgi:hypothetical protein
VRAVEALRRNRTVRPFELRCDRDECAAMDSGGLIREVRGLADVFGDPKEAG